MAFVVADRVRETTTTTGTGALTLAGAVTNFQAFAAKMAIGDTTWYAILSGSQWETGIGTLTASTTLTRTTVLDGSNGGSAVNLASGIKDVIITLPGPFMRPAITSEVVTGTDLWRYLTSKELATELTRRRATQAQVDAATDIERYITPKELAATTLQLTHPNKQLFLGTSGTWTKPAGAALVLIEVIDGGNAGNQSAPSGGVAQSALGGDGGEYAWRLMLASDLPATVPANVGAGGTPVAAGAGAGSGGAGGLSYFGSSLAASYLSTRFPGPSYHGVAAAAAVGGSANKGGAAGGSASGGSGGAAFGGGTSVEAGNGGAAGRNVRGTDGSVPGGGGGASNSATTTSYGSGAGGAGGIRVTSI